MLHRGRHATEYHQYMLDGMKEINKVAKGDKKLFLELFDNLKQTVIDNPDILYKAFWR